MPSVSGSVYAMVDRSRPPEALGEAIRHRTESEMSSQFRLIPLRRESIKPLLELDDDELRPHMARWLVADDKPGYPCRASLVDAEVGERVLLLQFVHHDVDSPYRASGPIFIR